MATKLTRFFDNGKPGEVAYFAASDSTVQSTASRKGWRCCTNRLLAISASATWREITEGRFVPIELTQVTLIKKVDSETLS